MSTSSKKSAYEGHSSAKESESEGFSDVTVNVTSSHPTAHPSRKKSDMVSTSSHESLHHTNSSPAIDFAKSPSPSQSPEHSPKEAFRGSSEMKLNPPTKLTTSGSSSSLLPSLSPIFQPNSREVSVEKLISETDIVGIAGLCLITNGGPEAQNYQDNLSRSSESGKSVDGTFLLKTPDSKHDSKSDKSSKSGDKKKKTSSWYNMLNPTYKSRSDDFKRLFKDLPESERLIVDYSCALQKDILVHGRLYVSQNYFCFYANIFRWETFVLMKCRDITSMTKEKTARVIPNAIQISSDSEKHFFTSFGARDKTYLMLFRIWQNALLDQPMSSQELWQWVHFSYGEELGLTSDDDDYVHPNSAVDDDKSITMSEQSLTSKENGQKMLDQLSGHEVDIDGSRISLSNGSLDILDAGDGLFEVEQQQLMLNQGDIRNKVHSSDYPPTDLSDTTESDAPIEGIEVQCPATHEGKDVLNAVYPISVDQLFALIFSGSKFMHDLLESRKTYDIVESPWQICSENGIKMRQLTYTITLNHSMAKNAQITDTQSLLKHSKPGQVYAVDCEIVNTGVPYSDTFCVKSHYCMSKISNQESRLRACGQVVYKKTVWGLVKSLIEKSAMQGFMDYCTDLDAALKKEAISHPGKKSRRRKRIKLLDLKSEGGKETCKSLHTQTTLRKIAPTISGIEINAMSQTSDLVIRVILATLVALLLLNGLLFYKLWSLEDQSLYLASVPSDFDLPPESHYTKEYMQRLLRQQEVLHRAESEKWKAALTDVIKLLRLMENSLSDLKSSIDTYGSSSFLRSISRSQPPTVPPVPPIQTVNSDSQPMKLQA